LVTIDYHCMHHLVRPVSILGISVFLTKEITAGLSSAVLLSPVISLGLSCMLLVGFYGSFLFFTRKKL
jgi:hypothetical protein